MPRDCISFENLTKCANDFCAELNGFGDFSADDFLDTYFDVSYAFAGGSRKQSERFISDVFYRNAQSVADFFIDQIASVDHLQIVVGDYAEWVFAKTERNLMTRQFFKEFLLLVQVV